MSTDPHLERPRSNTLDELLGIVFPVLDKGHVRVIDYMGDDAAIVQAARVSYGKGTKTPSDDRTLIRYLMRHRHTTPFEMCELKLHVRVPMDCWRQWIRHRTACLSGDTMLHFDLPGGIERRGNQLYKLSIKDVFDRFQPTENTQRPDKQRNPYHKKDQIQKMHLRSVNESTGAVWHTKIVDIWESGEKPVYLVTTKSGASAKMSEDHLCWSYKGWRKLKELVGLGDKKASHRNVGIHVIGSGRNTGVVPQFNPIDEATEEWAPIYGWEDFYEVSNQGRVRRIIGGKGNRSYGRCKKITVSDGRAVVSLNRPGEQVTKLVHHLVLFGFKGPSDAGQECCHNDGNALNNMVENLRWDTPQSNADDRVRDNATTRLRCFADEIDSVDLVGSEMTYDLEVEGPWHNFSAGGLVVHNSVNEYSTRYSEAIDDKQTTTAEQWRSQSKSNKQGSAALIEADLGGAALTKEEAEFHENATRIYKNRISDGVAREQARKDLPLSTYTEAYWKCNLHNLFHFLSLRMDAHAQKEIRDYANVIGNEIVAQWVPHAWEAFKDYRLEGMFFSGPEIAYISAYGISGLENQRDSGWLSKRETSELIKKVERLKP